jgi:hypothetical protein
MALWALVGGIQDRMFEEKVGHLKLAGRLRKSNEAPGNRLVESGGLFATS